MHAKFRSKDVRRQKQASTQDVELQHPQRTEEGADKQTCYVEYLQRLFGLPELGVRAWPGAMAYCRHMEKRFLPLLTDEYAFLWTVIGENRPQSTIKCWPIVLEVASIVHGLKDEESSIEDIWDRLKPCRSSQHALTPTPSSQQMNACFISIFSVLCWGTMTLQPKLDWVHRQANPSLRVCQEEPDHPGLKMDSVRRPIPAVFRHFRRIMPTTRWRHPIGESKGTMPTLLHVASLNYTSLHVIGKIHVVWVDNLSSHLDFNATNRRLSIFKFPSFCALSILANDQTPRLFVGLVRALYSNETDPMKDCEPWNHAQAHQEVLMSYRLLFGQNHEARRLAKAALRALRDEDGDYDDLLEVICTRPCDSKVHALPISLWPVTCRSFEKHLQEEDAYSSQDDFPLFGERLAKLQEFSLRQQPSKLRDLWRDRRHPLQWYTFWAVLIVGGFSIIIAILQLLVAVAQLVTSLSPPQSCQC